MSAGLVLLGCLAVALVSAALFTVTYNMSATTTLQSVSLYSDPDCTVLISPSSFVLVGTLGNGTVLSVYAKNVGNVAVAITVVPLTAVNCTVVYAPLSFPLVVNQIVTVTLTFSNVVAGSTATWSFTVDAS